MNKVKRGAGCAALICILIITSVSCGSKEPAGQVALRINDYSMQADEFERLFLETYSDDTPDARSIFLENVITRKLLLQEAQEQGLDKEEAFLKSVQDFWEQSLLRLAIDRKLKEISDSLRVNENEINAVYMKWRQKNPEATKPLDDLRDAIKLNLLKKKEQSAINRWAEELRSNSVIEIDNRALGIE